MSAHRLIPLAATLLIATAHVVPAATTPERPNIVFIFTDDHAVQATSSYGSTLVETPNIDRLARGGMRFDKAYVANSICGPARATILTGTHSHRNKFYLNNLAPFDGSQQTFPKILQNAGYQTAIIGKWHLESDPTGFDHWEVLSDLGGQGQYYDANFATPDGETPSNGYVSTVVTDKAIEWLATERDPSRPFLLMYQHKAPHRGFTPGPDEIEVWDDEAKVPEPPTLFDCFANRASVRSEARMRISDHLLRGDVKYHDERYENDPQLGPLWKKAFGPGNDAFDAAPPTGTDRTRWLYQRYIKSYLATVTSTDREIGRLLDALDEMGLTENTLIVYTSDQGFFLGEHGWFDKRWIDEESARIPLLVQWPGVVEPGSVNDDLVQNLDFAQTLLEAAGADADPRMQGQSFLPQLRGEQPESWRTGLYYHYYEFPGFHGVAKHYGVITKRYKLVHYYEAGEWELFDLELDPDELVSRYDDPTYAEVRKDLETQLTALRRQYEVPDVDEAPNWWQARLGDAADRALVWWRGFPQEP